MNPRRIVFKHNGHEFDAYSQACAYLKQSGYSIGSMQGHHPIGIVKGEALISKWTRMSLEELELLDGAMKPQGSGFKDGDVVVELRARSA
jgi:hypothetical protein